MISMVFAGAKCKKLTHLDISGVSISKMCLRKVCEDCTKLQVNVDTQELVDVGSF